MARNQLKPPEAAAAAQQRQRTKGATSTMLAAITLLLAAALVSAGINFAPPSLALFVHASASPPSSTALSSSSSTYSLLSSGSVFTVRQVQVVHRHGDRTPITPMKDESFWKSALPDRHVLEGISRGTVLKRHRAVEAEKGAQENSHAAMGRGPFGQLTSLGVLQMVRLGERLREELSHHDEHRDDHHHVDDFGLRYKNKGRLFTRDAPLRPERTRVISTDFPRTVQSVQGVLTGLFPDAEAPRIEIDVRHTDVMIPDPQPRRSAEQVELERRLVMRPHLLEREEQMADLARRTTRLLSDHLAKDARNVSFGVGEDGDDRDDDDVRPLPWVQLSEIVTCLGVRELLPPAISREDQEQISKHAAWRWFETLSHPRLAKLAMHQFAETLVENMHKSTTCPRRKSTGGGNVSSGGCDGVTTAVGGDSEKSLAAEEDEEPWLYLYSAHDSTLIGLLCMLRLEKPDRWPEYGSFIKIELIHEEMEKKMGEGGGAVPPIRHWVRFSLNGQTLRSTWCTDDDGKWARMVPLEALTEMIHSDPKQEKEEIELEIL